VKGLLIFLLLSCSSAQKKEMATVKDQDLSENIEKDYVVKDASSNLRPGWIVDAQLWAKKMKYDIDKNHYFSFETQPKVSREIACDLAKANARVDVASQISTYVQKSLAQAQAGIANAEASDSAINSYVDRSMVEKIENVIVGASVEKLHWEKRNYKQSRGARRDYTGFTCAAMVKVAKSDLKASIAQIRSDMINRSLKVDQKEVVKKALERASNNYLNLRGM